MPQGQVIGRVSIKVLPDTDQFKAKLKAALERIENSVAIEVPTKINMSGASRQLIEEVRKMNQRNRALDSRKITLYTRLETGGMREEISKAVRNYQAAIESGKRSPKLRLDVVAGTLKTELDRESLKRVEDQLKNWRDRVSPLDVMVKPQLMLGSTTWIEKRMDYMTRPRTIPIVPVLSKPGVAKFMASWATFMAAMSGGRVIDRMLRNLLDFGKNLDKLAPKIAGVGLGIVAFGASALASASNLFALSASLASIAPLALTLPASFMGAAIGVGVLVAAFKDFNTVLPSVQTRLSALQDMISSNFWAKAKQPISDLIDNLLPQFSKGLGETATAFGSFFANLSSALSGSLDGAIGPMFDQLNKAIAIGSDAAGPFANSIKVLGEVGAAYLPRMADWIVKITTQFNSWLSAAAADGRLQAWIDNALVALHDLGQVFVNLGGILGGFGSAASAAGGSSLGMLATTLERINETVNSAGFQTGLINAFRGAHEAMSLIAIKSGPGVSEFFTNLANTLPALFSSMGASVGTLLGALGSALAQPAVMDGLLSMFTGLQSAITAIGPSLTPLAAGLGAIGSLVGTLLAAMGPSIAIVFTTLGNAVSMLAPSLDSIVRLLSAGMASALQALAPLIMQVVGAFGTFLSGGLFDGLMSVVTALIPVLAQVGAAIMPIFTTLFSVLGSLMPIIGQAIASLLPLVGQLIAAIAPLVQAILPVLGAILGAIIPIIVSIASAVLPPVIAAITALVAAVTPVINLLGTLLVGALNMLAPVFTWLGGVIGSFISGFIGGFTSVFAGVMSIFNGFKTMFSGGWSNFFSGLWAIITGAFQVIWGIFNVMLFGRIFGVVKGALTAIKAFFTTSWAAIKLNVQVAMSLVQNAVRSGINGAKGAVTSGLNSIKGFFSSVWTNIKSITTSAFNGLQSAVRTGLDRVVSHVRGLPGQAKSALGNIGSTLLSAGESLIRGFISGIKNMIGGVKDTLQGLTSKLTSWKGPESLDRVLLTHAGELVIEGFIKGLENRYGAVRKSLHGLTRDVAGTDFQLGDIKRGAAVGSLVDAALGQDGSGFAAGDLNLSIDARGTSATPEDIADELLFAIRKLRAGGAY